MNPPTAWPLLVAAGRQRDYTILLAPDFLVADLDYGVLEQVVRPGPGGGPATVVAARTAAGRRLSIVYSTHVLTPGDLARGPARDEHNRPLRLMYGFVTTVPLAGPPDPADLSTALAAALPEYRRFLADEDRSLVTPSAAFPLRSRVSAVVVRPVPGGRRVRASLWVGGAAGLAGAGVIAAIVLALGPGGRPSPPCGTASPTVGPTATCPPTSPSPARSGAR